jgi:hypothetical protein
LLKKRKIGFFRRDGRASRKQSPLSGDQAVEADIFFYVSHQVALVQIALDPINAFREVCKERGRDLGETDGMNFKELAETIKIASLLEGELANIGPAPRLDGDQAIALEAIERFAHRRFTDAKLAGEEFFSEPRSFAE